MVSVLALLVALLALVLGVAVVYNGSSRQATYESNRQLCVDGLARYTRTITEIQLTKGIVTSTQAADLLADEVRTSVTCFDTNIIDSDSAFVQDWHESVRNLHTTIGLRRDESNNFVFKAANEIVAAMLAQQVDAINVAFSAAIQADGPGYWPWQPNSVGTPGSYPSISPSPVP